MTWRVAKSLIKFRDQVNALAPKRDKSSDGTIGDEAHASRSSDHNPWIMDGGTGVVTALDITHDPKNGVDTYKLAEHLRLTKDPRIKYVISNKKIFSFEIQPWQWRTYTGSNPHDQHVHISVRGIKSMYDLETPWDLTGVGKVDPNSDPVPIHPLLKKGATGVAVGLLQKLLDMTEVTTDERYLLTRLLDAWLLKPDFVPVPYFGPLTDTAVRDFQSKHALQVDGIVGPYTWRLLEAGGKDPQVNRNIVATVFGGQSDYNTSAYDDKYLNDTDRYVALPYRFVGKRPTVKVTSRETGDSMSNVAIRDIGPWNTNDPYWLKMDGRPQAESGTDTRGRKTNHAGIDLSPQVAKLLGIDGKGIVDWQFDG